MATLHVRNVPEELYEQLRRRAEANGRSIGSETMVLIEAQLGDAASAPRLLGRRRRQARPGLFTRFTEQSRSAVVQAQEEARSLGHDHVGTEHLVLGVLGVDGAGA